MRPVKSIDELYSEVKDLDLVICNDAPLATALNNRLDRPRIGVFATTPRHLAAKEAIGILGEGVWNDLRIVSRISDDTGYDLRFVHGEVENIRTIRRYRKDVKRYLHSISARRIYDSFSELPTIEKVMDSYDAERTGLFADKEVAVIGLDLFDDLDKHFVPLKGFADISIFKHAPSDACMIDTIYESGNDRQAADDAVDMISRDISSDVAIVMDVSGPIADSVRSALYRKGIPFKNTLSVRDLSQVRDYIEFLTLALSFETLRAKNIRELFSSYGGNVPHRFDEYLLSVNTDYIKDARARTLTETMRDIRSMTFTEACDVMFDDSTQMKRSRSQVRMLLEDLGMTDAEVTDDAVGSMMYAVNNISDLRNNEEIPQEEREGVLLVDCSRSVYIDRPFVIYIGMGYEWHKDRAGRDYIDREAERDMDAERFQALLQQGTFRMYIVNSMKNGKPPRPCLLFDHALGTQSRSFRNVCGRISEGGWSAHPDPERKERVRSSQTSSPGKFSKSSLNNYVECPLKYMFNELVRAPENEHTVFGNVMHEFAEFCICHPDVVDANGEEMYAEMISERFAGLACPELREVDRSRIRVAVKNIRSFASSVPRVPLDSDADGRNMFFRHHSLDRGSSCTEAWFASERTPLEGRCDLVIDGTIVDYKTGAPDSLDGVKKKMDPGCRDRVELQPLVYLAMLDDMDAGDRTFKIFYLMENASESASDAGYDINRNIRTVRSVGTTTEEYIRTGLKDRIVSQYPAMEDVWHMFADLLVASGPRNTGDWLNDDVVSLAAGLKKKTVAERAIKKAAGMMSGPAIMNGTELMITSDMLDGFRSFVVEKHEEMTLRRNTSFPPSADKRRCERCDFLSMCIASPQEDADG